MKTRSCKVVDDEIDINECQNICKKNYPDRRLLNLSIKDKNLLTLNKNFIRVSVYSWCLYMYNNYNYRKYHTVITNIHTFNKNNNIVKRRFVDEFSEDGIGVYIDKTGKSIDENRKYVTYSGFKNNLNKFIRNRVIKRIIIPCTYYSNTYGEYINGVIDTNSHMFCLIINKLDDKKNIELSIFESYTHLAGFRMINKEFLEIFKTELIDKTVKIRCKEYNAYIKNKCKSPSMKFTDRYIKNMFNMKNKYRDNGYCEIITKVFINMVIKYNYYDFFNDYMCNPKSVLRFLINYDNKMTNLFYKMKYLKHLKKINNKLSKPLKTIMGY